MNFPTQQHWFDSVWPEFGSGSRVLVPVHRHTNLEEVDEAATKSPQQVFMLLIEDFDDFSQRMPDLWRRMNAMGVGGIPPNVWVGAGIDTQKEADERMRRLVKIRARILFLVLKKGHRQDIDLFHGLIAWRCSSCGLRGGYAHLKRPEKCPSGSICDGAKLNPQIHWVVSMDPYKSGSREARCDRLEIAFWDGQSTEVPE